MPIKMIDIKNTDNTKKWWDVEQLDLSCIAGGNVKWYNHFGNLFGSKHNQQKT